MKIVIENGERMIVQRIDDLNAMLQQHGLHIAPLPAPPSGSILDQATTLAEIAGSLNKVVAWPSRWSHWRCKANGEFEITERMGDRRTVLVDEFRTILLGVMAAYVGEDVAYFVPYLKAREVKWSDTIEMYATCCEAMAARRKGGT